MLHKQLLQFVADVASICRRLPLALVTNQEAYFRRNYQGTWAPRGDTRESAPSASIWGGGWGEGGRGGRWGTWGRTWINKRGVGAECIAEWVEEWEMWGPQRALLSSLQGLSSTGLFSVETWPGWSRGGGGPWGCNVMKQDLKRRPPAPTGTDCFFSKLCHLCVILSEAVPPPVHQRQKHQARQKSPREAECAKCIH